jgi:predicted MPP superfamily phosphohydrolase
MAFTAIAWIVTAANLAAAALVLQRPWQKHDSGKPVPITLSHAALAAVAAAGPLLLECLAGLGRNQFGIIRLAYLHLAVLAPAMGILVLILAILRRFGRRPYAVSRPVKILAGLTLLAIPLAIYATFIEPFRLKLETAHASLRDARGPGPEIRIAVLADIQTDRVGGYERRAVDLAMAQHPDIILLPGDLWQGDDEPTADDVVALHKLLGRLSAPGKAWFVPGNVDSPAWLEKIFAGTPVILLNNAISQVQVKGRRVTIGGVALAHENQAAAVIQELEGAPGSDDIRILLAHLPDNVMYLQADSRIDLVVAGHTHGGQVVIPGLGPLMTLSHVPRAIAAGGLHHLNGNPIYVSRGIGCERGYAPRIRFLCPPEVSLITIGARQ